jgi:hypothetical protein
MLGQKLSNLNLGLRGGEYRGASRRDNDQRRMMIEVVRRDWRITLPTQECRRLSIRVRVGAC